MGGTGGRYDRGWWGGAGGSHVPVTPASRLAANQYHFPVLEAGNYEVERLCDLSPLLHYSPDIKINCLILGKHMLQFKLSALVCSGIICIDLLASSPFCLLTSWIIREKETQGGKAGLAFEYLAGEMKSTWEGGPREHYGLIEFSFPIIFCSDLDRLHTLFNYNTYIVYPACGTYTEI